MGSGKGREARKYRPPSINSHTALEMQWEILPLEMQEGSATGQRRAAAAGTTEEPEGEEVPLTPLRSGQPQEATVLLEECVVYHLAVVR